MTQALMKHCTSLRARKRGSVRDSPRPTNWTRPVGETAPLIMVGASVYVAFDPTLLGPYTALPVQIYNWTKQPDPTFQTLAAAGAIVLLAIVLSMNAVAIFLRNRYRRQW